MATAPQTFQTDFRQSSPLGSENKEWLLPRKRLKEIANVFDVSKEKIKKFKGNDWGLQDKCFKKIVRACESDNWGKINTARELIFGIRDSKGRTIYEVLTSEEEAPPNFCADSPENLVFQGGGPKGIAYIGTIEVLEERKVLPNVKRIAGTSAGAITATLIAFGYTSAEAKKLLTEKSLIQFLDFPSCQGGLAKGEDFLKWINDLIEAKTGIKNCTFGELRKEIKRGKPYKHLHVFAIKVGVNKEIFQFSSEDKRWDNLVIADANRASMSLPVVFHPYTLRFKNQENQLCYDQDACSFMDGGILVNLPIEAFDKKRYLQKSVSQLEGECPVTNKRTLAFSLYTPGENILKKDTQINCTASAYFEYRAVRQQAVSIFKKHKTYDKYRTVMISNVQVGTFLGFFENQEKLDELIESGRACTESFFREKERCFARLVTFEKTKEIIDYQPSERKSIYLIYKNTSNEKLIVGVEIFGDNVSFHTDYLCSFASILNPMKDQFSFARLSEHDNRFLLFVYLSNKEFEKANDIFKNHIHFFKNCFLWDIFKKLIIEQNKTEYITFFAEKGFSFSSPKTNLMWYAYGHNAFKACNALLQLPDIDLKAIDQESGQTFLHALIATGHCDLVTIFCSAFKARHPEAFKGYLAQRQPLERPYYSPDALDIAVSQNNVKSAELLIEEGVEFESKISGWAFSLYNRSFNRQVETGNSHRSSFRTLKTASYGFLMKVFSWDFQRKISSKVKMTLLDYCCGRWLIDGGEDAVWKLIVGQILPFPKEDLRDKNGNGPLLIVLKSPIFTWEYKLSLMNLLLHGKYPDDVNQSNDEGETPLIVSGK